MKIIKKNLAAIIIISFFVVLICLGILAPKEPIKESKIDEFNQYIDSFWDNVEFVLPDEIVSDFDTYQQLYKLNQWVYEQQKRIYEEIESRNLMSKFNNESISSFDQIMSTRERLFEELTTMASQLYIPKIVEMSSSKFMENKKNIIDYYVNNTKKIEDIEYELQNKDYADFVDCLIYFDYLDKEEETHTFPLFTKIYWISVPDKIHQGIRLLLDEYKELYAYQAESKISELEKFLITIKELEKYKSLINTVLEYANNKEIEFKDLPHAGMPIDRLESTALGEADEVEFCTGYWSKVPSHRWKTYIWYNDKGDEIVEAHVWDGKDRITYDPYVSHVEFWWEYAKFQYQEDMLEDRLSKQARE